MGWWAPILPVLSRPGCAAWLQMLAHRWLSPAAPRAQPKDIFTTAHTELCSVSYKARSHGQSLFPGSAFVIPEMALGGTEPTQQHLLALPLQYADLSSPKCNSRGDFICGQCLCHAGW